MFLGYLLYVKSQSLSLSLSLPLVVMAYGKDEVLTMLLA